MAISNCWFSPISENPRGFSAWFVFAKLIVGVFSFRKILAHFKSLVLFSILVDNST